MGESAARAIVWGWEDGSMIKSAYILSLWKTRA